MPVNLFRFVLFLTLASSPASCKADSTAGEPVIVQTPQTLDGKSDTVCTGSATVSASAHQILATLQWGGLAMFRPNPDEGKDGEVILSLTDNDDVVRRLLTDNTRDPCTLRSQKCAWTFRVIDWRPPPGDGAMRWATLKRTLVTVILRPDGPKLEDADVRIYMNGCERVTSLLVWKPPTNSDDTRLIADANWTKQKIF